MKPRVPLALIAGIHCVAALPAQHGDPPTTPTPHRLVKDLELPSRRGPAMMALWHRGAEAVPALVAALDDPRDEILERVCAVLHEMGPIAARASEPLEAAMTGAVGRRLEALRWAHHGVTTRTVVVAAWDGGKLFVLDEAGAAQKEVPGLENPWDVQSLPGDRYLVTEVAKSRVRVVDAKGNELWSYDELKNPHRAQRLWNGNTLIADCGGKRVVEVDPSGAVVWECGELAASSVQRLLNGNTLIAVATGRVVEVDAAGEVVVDWAVAPQTHGARRLPGGHTLVVERSEGRIRELDPSGEEVARLGGFDQPNTCLRLADGTTLVGTAQGVQARSADGAESWRYAATWVGGLGR